VSNFIESENDDEIVGVILSRREALAAATKAGFGLVLTGATGIVSARQNSTPVHLVASPQLEEGPFFVEEKLNRSNLLQGTTRPSVTRGLPLSLLITVHALQSGELRPMKGAHVDVWHTDASGIYSDISAAMNHENTAHQAWLRGFQVTDAQGRARFETIFPGWYPTRTTHIHLKIRKFSADQNVTAEFTTQLFFDDRLANSIFKKTPYAGRGERPITNDSDGVFGVRQADGTLAGDHLMLELAERKGKPGYSTDFSIALTDENFRAPLPNNRMH
jgi:protocatechuate 3,4-dioxygenase beta subunit